MEANIVRAGFAQTEPVFGRPVENLERARVWVERAAPYDVLVLPELFASGYVFESRAEVESLAEARGGPTHAQLAAWAKASGGWIVAGFPERDGDRVFDSAWIVGPDGTATTYRKIHRFGDETRWFDAGDEPPRAPSIETAAGTFRVGVMICFDWFFPEVARSLALAGAEVILHPSNLVLPHCQEAMRTRCLENRVFAVTANRTGDDVRTAERRLHFTGRSQIVDPTGNVLSRATEDGECVDVREFDLRAARDKRVTPQNDLFGDRRPSLYGGWAEPGGDPTRA
jgi:predicted amidohydrolase